MDLVNKFGDERARLDRINYSQIVLVPKEGSREACDFRPITLLQSSFKIISKVLSNRLAPVIGELIGDYQSGFIKRTSILEDIVVSKEVIYRYFKTRMNISSN